MIRLVIVLSAVYTLYVDATRTREYLKRKENGRDIILKSKYTV
jgi:hypothetical protein